MKMLIGLATIMGFLAVSTTGTYAQTPATGRLMREKLTHSQRILEAILMSNFALLERESTALGKATESPAWSVLKSAEYLRQSEAFLREIRDLNAAAKARDLDAAAAHYLSLTQTCFQCHRYVKDARIARL